MSAGIEVERCPACARHALPGRDFCPRCGGPVEVRTLPGEGEVVSAAEVHRAPIPSPVGGPPFALALVRLDAAPEVVVMVAAAEPPAIGAAVEVRALEAPGRGPYGLA